ncbi:MAG TPA: hypothetical protein VE545_01760 [Candidatus Dormibacteraeota bacterium]|nr:hypothetical protein [Candidatus Dormibacteraeota bacterium]
MNKWCVRSLVVLALSAIYLYGFPTPTLTYEAGVMVHLVAGIFFCVVLALIFARLWRGATVAARGGWVLLALGGAMGLALTVIGTPYRFRAWLFVHIGLCVLGTLVVLASWMASRGWLGRGAVQHAAGFAALLLLTAALGAGMWWTRTVAWKKR